MGLRFITGKTGSGKTTLCMEEITRGTRNINYIYIVPEQFSMESEKALTMMSKSQVLINKKVFSFRHLAMQMLSKYGSSKKLFEDTGKNMLLRKLALECSDKLCFYTKSFDKEGFLNQLAATITEFTQYGISTDMLQKRIADVKNEALRLKLSDLSTIYDAYADYVSRELISGDTVLDVLYEMLDKCEIIKGSCIWIDGFNSFTPQEYKVIGGLLKYAEQVTVSVTMPSANPRLDRVNIFDAYYETKSCVNRLIKIAGDTGVKIEKGIFLDKDVRHNNSPALAFLTQNYLAFEPCKYEYDTSDIEVYAANNMYEEINNVCSSIRELVAKKNINYGDIAVIIGSENYLSPLRASMKSYCIACHGDEKKPVLSNPLTKFILNAVDAVAYHFSADNIFAMLKTGFTDMCFDDICELENYVLENGIKGYYWEYDEWKKGFGKYSICDSVRINTLKDCVKECLNPLTSKVEYGKKYTITHISAAVYDMLYKCGVPEKLNAVVERYKNEGNNEAADINRSIWQVITNVFEKMTEILGDNLVTASDYSKILKSGLSACMIGQAPPTQDYVLIGDAERTRLNNIRVLFVLGVNEGVLPPYHEDIGIFFDAERGFISKNLFELAPDNSMRINRDRYLIYNCLCKPAEKLVLSYSCVSLSGGELKPSGVVSTVLDMFPKTEAKPVQLKNNAPIPAFEEFLQVREGLESFSTLKNWFSRSTEFSQKYENIKKELIAEAPAEYLDKHIASQLYNDNFHIGVTSLESYTKCPFAFFIKYGLKARERKKFSISSPDTGNLFHYVLENFSKNLKDNNLDWRSLTREQIDKYVDIYINSITENMAGSAFTSSARFRRLAGRVKKMTAKSIWAMSEHIKAGNFEPLGYEVGFGPGEKLPPVVFMLDNGKRLMLTGKADRVDILDKDGKSYVKIIDYKSYDMSYDLTSVYYGLQMQLALYMSEFVKNGKRILNTREVLPGGMFYFRLKDPLIEAEINTEQNILDAASLKGFGMSGMLLDNSDVIEAMDREADLGKRSILANLRPVSGSSVLATDAEFKGIMSYVDNIVRKTGTDITNGKISVKPYKKGEKTGCDYCELRAVCRFETNTSKNKYNVLKSIKKGNIMNMFAKDDDNIDDNNHNNHEEQSK